MDCRPRRDAGALAPMVLPPPRGAAPCRCARALAMVTGRGAPHRSQGPVEGATLCWETRDRAY